MAIFSSLSPYETSAVPRSLTSLRHCEKDTFFLVPWIVLVGNSCTIAKILRGFFYQSAHVVDESGLINGIILIHVSLYILIIFSWSANIVKGESRKTSLLEFSAEPHPVFCKYSVFMWIVSWWYKKWQKTFAPAIYSKVFVISEFIITTDLPL